MSALKRKESRGLHFTLDYPKTDISWIKDTVLQDTTRRLVSQTSLRATSHE